MKNSELIEKLKTFPPEAEVVMFGGGELFPTLDVNILECLPGETLEGSIEIAGGWSPVDE